MSESRRLSFLSPLDLHRQLINHYVLTRKGATSLLRRDTSKDKRDIDVIRENHKFLWSESDEPDTWEKKLAKKYYDKLFKEYCICDLSRFKENKVAMRWQTESELISGKGQFICGEKHCIDSEGLRTWEINFGYVEGGEKKNALVKLRSLQGLCPECSYKLNYKHKRKEVKRKGTKRSISTGELDKSRKKLREVEVVPTSESPKSDESQTEKDVISEEERNIWKETGTSVEERSRDEDFEEYLEQLLL